MFTVTTINHKTVESLHPLLMITNREGQRYFFGKISEGCQRVLNENKYRLSKLKGIFLTGTLSSWSEIGGLPGLFLTISDSTKQDVDVFTNNGGLLSYIVSTWRYFVFRKGVEIKIHDTDPEKIIADSNILLRPIKIKSNAAASPISNSAIMYRQLKKLITLMFPLNTSTVNDPDPESYKSDPAEQDIQSHVIIDDIPLHKNQESLNYLVRFIPIRGKFDPVKAKELGVLPGLNFRYLTQGVPVKNKDDELVYPHQVMEKPKPFPKVLILDIPDNTYLENTISSELFFQKNEENGDEEIGLVYHLLGDEIDFRLEAYTNFMSKFPSNCQHVISHSSVSSNTVLFRKFSVNLLKLKSIQNGNYNLPFSERYSEKLIGDSVTSLQEAQVFNIKTDEVTFDDSRVDRSSWSEMFDEHVAPLELPGVDKQEILKEDPIPISFDPSKSLKDNIQISTLGTGSALPSVYRNVISNLIRIPVETKSGVEFKSILLDGGENTLGAMLRTFGNDEQYVLIFEELGLIFLSHLHADHHLGLISVINKWFEINKHNDKTLHLVLPWQYDHFVKEWYRFEHRSYHDISRINYVSCEDFLQARQPEYSRISIEEFEENFDKGVTKVELSKAKLEPLNHEGIARLYEDLNILHLQTCRAIHCFWSYSVSIKFKMDEKETFKVSYSGDTRPNTRFIDIGRDSDLLIHESSLDNELIEEAISKKHTTMIEAVNICRYMNCPNLILTHFSTRYSNGANFINTKEEFQDLTDELKAYLKKYRAKNIFQLENKDLVYKLFDDLNILFAFDTLILRLNEVGDQKKYLRLINDSLELNDDEDEKKTEKKRIKREAKRIQRLSLQKKRKTSESE